MLTYVLTYTLSWLCGLYKNLNLLYNRWTFFSYTLPLVGLLMYIIFSGEIVMLMSKPLTCRTSGCVCTCPLTYLALMTLSEVSAPTSIALDDQGTQAHCHQIKVLV